MLETYKTAVWKFLSLLSHNFKKFSSLALSGVFLAKNFYRFQVKPNVLKVVVSILSTLVFLFLHPAIVAQTHIVQEAVVPQTTKTAYVTITENVSATKVPDFSSPSESYGYVSTFFSARHQGIDIPSPYGGPIKPVAEGEVTFAGWSTLGYGQLVTIAHEGGFSSLYAHLSAINVKVGQKVNTQEPIGRIGTSGVATGAHLHLEIHFFGTPINPLTFISLEQILAGIK